jgi:cytochrome c oxidase cbb3-type subunit 4
MDINLLREATTVLSLAIFIGVIWFAVHPANKARFDEAARLPLEDDLTPTQPPPQPSPKGEGANVRQVFVMRRSVDE